MRVRQRRGAKYAHYDPAPPTIAIPLDHTGWALRELVVLHELAHHLDDDRRHHAGHGPEFCSRYLELVDSLIGVEAGFLLRATLLDCDVPLR